MTVYELSREQLDELKIDLFYNWESTANRQTKLLYNGIWTKTDYFWELPDEIVYFNYDGITFVNDDFACTAN